MKLRLVVYRTLAAGKKINRTWHDSRQLHIDFLCARRHAHRTTAIVRQAFDYEDIIDVRKCKFCFPKDPRDPCLLTHSKEEREQYLWRMRKRWDEAYTQQYSIVLEPCEVL